MRFSPEVWMDVLQDVLEGHQDYLERLQVDQEDARAAVLHEIEVLEDILGRVDILSHFTIVRTH